MNDVASQKTQLAVLGIATGFMSLKIKSCRFLIFESLPICNFVSFKNKIFAISSYLKLSLSLTSPNSKLRGLSPRVNYTDRANTSSAKLVPTFINKEASLSQRNASPTAVISVF
jgi:hypothetical protein